MDVTITANQSFISFHGRNTKGHYWYNYLYSEQELKFQKPFDMIQINATVIAGILIFLTINASTSQNGGQNVQVKELFNPSKLKRPKPFYFYDWAFKTSQVYAGPEPES